MKTLWINSASARELQVYAEHDFPVETGGILVGYFAENGDIVVKNIVGPGPNAKHERFSFVPDHTWQCGQLDMLYERSAGIDVYLGDWHTHPNGSPKMSWADRRTLRRIASHPLAGTRVPVMLIGGGGPHEWVWHGSQYQSPRLWGFSSDCSTFDLKIY